MPNWCSTHIEITGSSENIDLLYSKIDEWRSKTKHGDLDQILELAGIDVEKYSCRGTLESCLLCIVKEGDEYLVLDTETAWTPMIKMWRAIIEKYVPDVKLYWIAEEPGCEIYETNDVDYKRFDYDYVIDYSFSAENSPFRSEKLKQYFNERLNEDFYYCNSAELIELFEEEFNTNHESVIVRRLKEISDDLSDNDWFNIHGFERGLDLENM